MKPRIGIFNRESLGLWIDKYCEIEQENEYKCDKYTSTGINQKSEI